MNRLVQCDNCLAKLCKKHPLQDHGARAREIKDKSLEKKSAAMASFGDRIKNQIEKMQKNLDGDGAMEEVDEEGMRYKAMMEAERERASKKKRTLTAEEEAYALTSGLNPSTMKMMMGGSDEDSDEDSDDSDSDDGSSKKRKRKGKD